MPNITTPSLRQLPDGRYFTSWGGRRHYLGRDRTEAATRFAESLALWAEHRRRQGNGLACPSPRVIDLIEQFIAAKSIEVGDEAARYYRKCLRRFNNLYGGHYSDTITALHINTVKTMMLNLGLSAKTVNHTVIATKAMLQWAIDNDRIPVVNLNGAKCMPLGPPRPRALDFLAVHRMVMTVATSTQLWLGVQYLTACRPVEVIRLAHGRGEWVKPGIFRLDRGKMDRKTRIARHIVVSPLALLWLEALIADRSPPRFARLDSYSAAVRRECGPGGPHPLRHSAATHLLAYGTPRELVEQILGHMPSRVSLVYAQPDWPTLRAEAARLLL